MTAKVRTVVPAGEERSRQFELRLTLADSSFNVGAGRGGLARTRSHESLVVPRDAIAVRVTVVARDAVARSNSGAKAEAT